VGRLHRGRAGRWGAGRAGRRDGRGADRPGPGPPRRRHRPPPRTDHRRQRVRLHRRGPGRPAAAAVRPTGLLPRIRYAQEYEALRDRAEAADQRPRVYLASLGPFAAHSARAGFAANLFQAAGIACVTGPVEEFTAADTTVACLCSSDKVYADEAAGAAKLLREAGATQIWLAGKAEVDGVDGNLFAGCDALAVLRSTFETLGVQ